MSRCASEQVRVGAGESVSAQLHTDTYIHTYIHTQMHTHTHIQIHKHTDTQTCTHTHARTHNTYTHMQWGDCTQGTRERGTKGHMGARMCMHCARMAGEISPLYGCRHGASVSRHGASGSRCGSECEQVCERAGAGGSRRERECTVAHRYIHTYIHTYTNAHTYTYTDT